MTDYSFKRDQKLKALHFTDGEDIFADSKTTITVVMENGQMVGVPWAVVDDGTSVRKWNLALVLGVEMETDK